jgi:hypothetical protein
VHQTILFLTLPLIHAPSHPIQPEGVKKIVMETFVEWFGHEVNNVFIGTDGLHFESVGFYKVTDKVIINIDIF